MIRFFTTYMPVVGAIAGILLLLAVALWLLWFLYERVSYTWQQRKEKQYVNDLKNILGNLEIYMKSDFPWVTELFKYINYKMHPTWGSAPQITFPEGMREYIKEHIYKKKKKPLEWIGHMKIYNQLDHAIKLDCNKKSYQIVEPRNYKNLEFAEGDEITISAHRQYLGAPPGEPTRYVFGTDPYQPSPSEKRKMQSWHVAGDKNKPNNKGLDIVITDKMPNSLAETTDIMRSMEASQETAKNSSSQFFNDEDAKEILKEAEKPIEITNGKQTGYIYAIELNERGINEGYRLNEMDFKECGWRVEKTGEGFGIKHLYNTKYSGGYNMETARLIIGGPGKLLFSGIVADVRFLEHLTKIYCNDNNTTE